MTDSDAVPCRWGIWDVLRNKIADVKFSLLLKLKNCGCGELFRNRTKPKDCCWCIRHVEFHVGEAVTLCQDHLAIFRKKDRALDARDRKSTRLNSSHLGISYAVFCLKKKKNHN